MRYKIGDLAYLFNLSAESIRHYERQGIVHPQKVDGSTYRYYSATYRFHISKTCSAPTLDGEPLTGNRILLQDDGRIHEAGLRG